MLAARGAGVVEMGLEPRVILECAIDSGIGGGGGERAAQQRHGARVPPDGVPTLQTPHRTEGHQPSQQARRQRALEHLMASRRAPA
jgi:hypothetical protein